MLIACEKANPTSTTTFDIPQSPSVVPTKILISSVPPLTQAGQNELVSCGVYDQNDEVLLDYDVVWKSSNARVATVRAVGNHQCLGVVTAVGNGGATITATAGSITAFTQVIVEIP